MVIYDVKLPYKVRCNVPECGKPINHVFRQELDGIMCNFCSPNHAHLGKDRWEEKKRLDIRLGVTPQEEQTYVGDNLVEVEGR